MEPWRCPWFLPQEDGLNGSLRSWGGRALSPGDERAGLSVLRGGVGGRPGRAKESTESWGLHSTLGVASKLPLASEVETKGRPESLSPALLRGAFLGEVTLERRPVGFVRLAQQTQEEK